MAPQSDFPTYMPLDQAASHYGLSKEALLEKAHSGEIHAVQLPSGELLVAAENEDPTYQTKEEIIADKFAHLRGQTITPYAAEKKYGVHRNNFIRWARSGYIEITQEAERLIELDAADVAYCAYVYEQKKEAYGGSVAGVTLFDKKGNPYKLKYKEVAEQLRAERRQSSK